MLPSSYATALAFDAPSPAPRDSRHADRLKTDALFLQSEIASKGEGPFLSTGCDAEGKGLACTIQFLGNFSVGLEQLRRGDLLFQQ